MESGNSSSLHQELHSLRKSVRTAQCLTAALGVLVLALFIALIAVGASQGKRIKELRGREGLLDNPNVTFASNSGYRNMEGLTYGGSLFRGSGFWAGKTALPGKRHSLVCHCTEGFLVMRVCGPCERLRDLVESARN